MSYFSKTTIDAGDVAKIIMSSNSDISHMDYDHQFHLSDDDDVLENQP